MSFILFHISGGNIEIHIVQNDSSNISLYLVFICSQYFAKVSDFRAVGLSSRRTIDMHPIRPMGLLFFLVGKFAFLR